MMAKAKDYAKKYNDADEKGKALAEIGEAFLVETVEICKARKCQTDEAHTAVFNEQDRKWKAFARLVDGVDANGFDHLLLEVSPKAWTAWKLIEMGGSKNNG